MGPSAWIRSIAAFCTTRHHPPPPIPRSVQGDPAMRAALYARVSTERQERHQTIDSRLAALHAWVEATGHDLAEEHAFRDDGYSGARLDRPGLDGLRDAVRDGSVDVIAVLNPDRLARKYAYQVLLLEEFRRVGCEVAFLHHPISDDPNDQLLLPIQGAIAAYERAVLAERFRRGKLQKARAGQFLGRAPYGQGCSTLIKERIVCRFFDMRMSDVSSEIVSCHDS